MSQGRPRLLRERGSQETLETLLEESGEVFRRFDRQDSGNVSYGVRASAGPLFVKTAGPAGDGVDAEFREERVAALRRVARLHARFAHPALPALRNVIETASGPALVFDWVPGELLYTPREERDQPGCSHARFRALPPASIAAALETIFDLHGLLAAAGVVASDFYDGSILYDFATGATKVCDLDEYREAPFILERERNFGSTRFMAPEEFQRGARIDERTNVFTLGRAALVFLGDGSRERAAFRGSDALFAIALCACEPEREERYASIAALLSAWRAASPRPG